MIAEEEKFVMPRPAATVVLVRDGNMDLEVCLLKRSAKSGFMPGHYVFPGGTVDPQDRDARFWRDHVDMDPAGITERLDGDLPLEEILSYAVAVVRETFEEAGIFLGKRCSDVRGRLAEVRGAENERRIVADMAQGTRPYGRLAAFSFRTGAMVPLDYACGRTQAV